MLHGKIGDLNIEGFLFPKKLKLDLNEIKLTFFLPDISNILYSYPKPSKITSDPCKDFNYKSNEINSLFKLLDKLSFLSINIEQLHINMFIKIENILLHFSLLVKFDHEF